MSAISRPRNRVSVLALLILMVCASPSYALRRMIWDGSVLNNGTFLIDFVTGFNYTSGRSEGKPVRGPTPFLPLVGSTDVDKLYDYYDLINQYYAEKFGRNGPNGFGGTSTGIHTPLNEMTGYVNGNATLGGAFATWPRNAAEAASSQFRGSTSFTAGWVTPDIVGHETFHIVVNSNWRNPDDSWQVNPDGSWVRLIYQNESGALNEGMADFFGESFERWVTGTNDWLNAASVDTTLIPQPEMRNLADPLSAQNPVIDVKYPDRYLSPHFYEGTFDNGGVHINSTIISKTAYLASEGGTFNGYDVDGIGMDKVEQIFYHALTTYFDPEETFSGAYQDFLQSTADLYGPTELTEMTKALRAVELHLSRVVPEPSTGILLIAAIIGFFVNRTRRRLPYERTDTESTLPVGRNPRR